MRYLALVVGTVLSMGLAKSACEALASSPDPELHFRVKADPATLDWNLARSSQENYIIMNIMEGLVEEGPDLKPRPALAERWEISQDGKVYTFYLRSGVKWSDGQPLKAQDFVASWLRLLDPKTGARYAGFLYDIENGEAFHQGKIKDGSQVGVKALDDSRLQVRLRRIVPYFLHIPTFWVTFPIRKDLVQKNPKDWARPGRIVTLGPYQVSEWKKGQAIVLTRNPSYFGEKPQFGKVQTVIESSDTKARQLFDAGKLDFLLDPNTADLVRVREKGDSSKVRVVQFPYLATYYLGFNVNFGVLKNVGIRKSLALAIDRDAIPVVLQGGQIPAKGWIPLGLDGYQDKNQLSGTLYEARAALAQAGFTEGRGFPNLVLWVDMFDGAQTLADYLVKSYRDKLGIDIKIKMVSPAEFQKAIEHGEVGIFLWHWGADYPDPANFFEVFSSKSGTNPAGWKNTIYDQYLAKAGGTLDTKSRLEYFDAAERVLLKEDVVVVPLFFKRNTALVGKRIVDFQISPLNYLFLKNLKLAQ